MISVLSGFFEVAQSSFASDFVLIPTCSALIATIACLIIGIIKKRG